MSGLAQLRQLPLGVSNLGASGGDEALRLLSGSLDDASRLGSRLLQELPCIRTGTHENLGEIVFLPTVLREGVLQRCAATVALLPRGTRLQSKEKHQRIGILYQVANPCAARFARKIGAAPRRSDVGASGRPVRVTCQNGFCRSASMVNA